MRSLHALRLVEMTSFLSFRASFPFVISSVVELCSLGLSKKSHEISPCASLRFPTYGRLPVAFRDDIRHKALSIEHFQELVFTHDPDAELFGFLKFGGPHVLTRKDKRCLVGYRTYVLTTILLDDGLILITTVMGEDTTDHDALTFEFC